MLTHLRIRRLAVVDDESVPFHAGLNVVTGETGVGKSLLVDALLFLFGGKPLLVFDEIDSNVGGRLGDVLGRKLERLSAGRQVLVATHLPQVAAFADSHVRVRKEVVGGKTFARFETLADDARVTEIAEMIRGVKRTEVTLAEASEMIAGARGKGAAR